MKILKILITRTPLEADLDIHLSSLYQFFIFTITNLSAPYAVCGSIIVMCMFATALRNLIYKVLNLAILSVFVVALWAYLTDVTFIYVVYILTFVSAVVMLFLSVVLMLPSSAIAVTKRNFSFVLLAATASTSETSIVSTIVSTAACIVTLSLTLLAVYFVVAYIKSWKNRLTYIRHGHPRSRVSLNRLPYLMQAPRALPEYYEQAVRRGLRFAEGYYFYVYDHVAPNSHAVFDCKSSVVGNANFGTIKERWRGYDRTMYYSERGQKPVLITSLNVLVPERYPAPGRFRFGYPIYIRAVPRIVKDPNDRGRDHNIRRLLGMVIYEFINFYVYRLEPNFLKVGGFKLYNKIMRPIRAYANAGDDWLARYCYTSGGRAPILFYAAGDSERPVYLSIYTPWWSPFRVFNGSESIIGRILRNLYRRLRFHLTRRRPSKPAAPTAVNSYIPPAVSNVISRYILRFFSRLIAAVPSAVSDPISKYVRRFYNGIIRVINRIPDTLRIHPAVVLRLSDLKGNRALAAWYRISGWYFRCINFIFTNIELPLSSKTSAKSGFALFKQHYDFLAPAHRLSIPIGYNVTRGVYTNNVRRNKLIFLKNFLIFMIINLAYNVSIAATYVVIFLTLPSSLEIAAQVITTFSVFFIAVPVGIAGTWAAFTYSSYLMDACTSNLLENLAAVQHGLYVSQPLLLLVSITGLLVALIGAPFFISRSS